MKKKIIELLEVCSNIKWSIDSSIHNNLHEISDKIDQLERLYNGSSMMIGQLKNSYNELLMMYKMVVCALCEKYKKGTFIVYDEKDPRNILIINNGKEIDKKNLTHVSFNWYEGEFPTLEIERK